MKQRAWGMLVLLLAGTAHAREYEVPIVVSTAEDVYELQNTGDISEQTADLLIAFIERPIDINRADRDLLYELPQMTYAMADLILAFRRDHGPFNAVDELLNVPEMTPELLASIKPFIAVNAAVSFDVPASAAVQGSGKVQSLWREGLDVDDEDLRSNVIQYPPQTYLQVQGSGYSYFGAGLLATLRSRTNAVWSEELMQPLTNGLELMADLDSVYLTWGYSSWRIILGSYDAGFGERLTFDTSVRRDPEGWYELNRVYDDNQKGRIRVDEGLFGAAVSLEGGDLPFGWLDVTGFASSQLRDLFQNDMYFGGDGDILSCERDSECPGDFICGKDNLCRAPRLLHAEDPERSWSFVTYKDAFRETVFGANATLHVNDRTRFGVTGYQALADLQIAEEGSPRFSPSARYLSREGWFGAAGAFARMGLGPVMLSGEYATTGGGGHGVYGRAIAELGRWGETTVAGWNYGARFENPFSRGEAAPDETMGLRARNERGGRWQLIARPNSDLRLLGEVAFWQNPDFVGFDAEGNVIYQKNRDPQLDMSGRAQVRYRFLRDENAIVQFSYDNRNIAVNSREETYVDDAEVIASGIGDFFEVTAAGERRKLELDLYTTRIPTVRLILSADLIWQDTAPLVDSFAFEHRYRLNATVRAWEGGLLVANVTWWAEQVQGDTQYPKLDSYIDFRQTFWTDYAVKARVGLMHYERSRDDNFGWYSLTKLGLEARF